MPKKNFKYIQSSQKNRVCAHCGERIKKGSPYVYKLWTRQPPHQIRKEKIPRKYHKWLSEHVNHYTPYRKISLHPKCKEKFWREFVKGTKNKEKLWENLIPVYKPIGG